MLVSVGASLRPVFSEKNLPTLGQERSKASCQQASWRVSKDSQEYLNQISIFSWNTCFSTAFYTMLNLQPKTRHSTVISIPHRNNLLSSEELVKVSKQGSGTGGEVCVLGCSLCLTLPDPLDCSPPGSSVHGILQARILEWVAIQFT